MRKDSSGVCHRNDKSGCGDSPEESGARDVVGTATKSRPYGLHQRLGGHQENSILVLLTFCQVNKKEQCGGYEERQKEQQALETKLLPEFLLVLVVFRVSYFVKRFQQLILYLSHSYSRPFFDDFIITYCETKRRGRLKVIKFFRVITAHA
jgi:hypothetical protein